MKDQKLRDNLQYKEETEGVIFNHYSFCELIKHIMVAYGNTTYAQADKKLKQSFLHKEPKSLDDVEYLGHELEYHWAMLTLHGEMYWLKGIPSDFNDFKEEYMAWETKKKQQYALKDAFEYYDIKN